PGSRRGRTYPKTREGGPPRRRPALAESREPCGLRDSNVDGLGALAALAYLELDLHALVEVHAVEDVAVVDEHVLAAVIGRDEAVALVAVEELDGSLCHWSVSLSSCIGSSVVESV